MWCVCLYGSCVLCFGLLSGVVLSSTGIAANVRKRKGRGVHGKDVKRCTVSNLCGCIVLAFNMAWWLLVLLLPWYSFYWIRDKKEMGSGWLLGVGKLLFLFLLPHFFLCSFQRIKMDSHDIVKGLVKFFYVFGSDPSTYFLFARLCTNQDTWRAIFVLFHCFSGSFWCVSFHGHVDSAFLFRTGIQFRQRH